MYVLLHGYTDSASSYGPLCEYLPDALALTHREHGDASGVAAFMDEAGVDQAVIVGHSAGSATAQRFAVDHPERTLGVVLIGAVRSWPANPVVQELAAAVPELTDPVDRAFAREFQESMLARPVPAGFLEMVIDESASLPAAVWRDGIRRLATAPVPTDVGPITAPTLVLWGDRDIVCSRAEQNELLAAFPGAELVVYEGDGHSPHWERPSQVAADIAAFVSLRGLSRPRSSAAR